MAAPSANKFGQVSPTLAEHVRAEFPDEVAAGMPVLEGGASEVGIESTILDLSRLDQGAGPVLLRPGHVSAAQIEAVLGAQVFAPDAAAPRLGTLKAHYAPRTELELAGDARVADVLQGIGLPSGQVALVSFDPAPASTDARVQWRQVPSDPARYAQALYALLRAGRPGLCPHRRAAPPANDAWHAVNDRIGRPPPPSRSIPPTCSFRTVPPCRHASERRCASHGRLAAFPGLASGLAEPTGISSHLLDRASLLSRATKAVISIKGSNDNDCYLLLFIPQDSQPLW